MIYEPEGELQMSPCPSCPVLVSLLFFIMERADGRVSYNRDQAAHINLSDWGADIIEVGNVGWDRWSWDSELVKYPKWILDRVWRWLTSLAIQVRNTEDINIAALRGARWAESYLTGGEHSWDGSGAGDEAAEGKSDEWSSHICGLVVWIGKCVWFAVETGDCDWDDVIVNENDVFWRGSLAIL